MGQLSCLLEAPGPSREARAPKAPQRHSKDTVWVVWGCLLDVSGPPLGGLPAPKGTPKSLQGRGHYEGNDPKLKQLIASTLELHNSFPQGLWSSRDEAECTKRKQFGQFRNSRNLNALRRRRSNSENSEIGSISEFSEFGCASPPAQQFREFRKWVNFGILGIRVCVDAGA